MWGRRAAAVAAPRTHAAALRPNVLVLRSPLWIGVLHAHRQLARVRVEAGRAAGRAWHRVQGFGYVRGPLQDDLFGQLLWIAWVTRDQLL